MPITSLPGDPRQMEFDQPLVFPDHPLAHRYCVGNGIELGAAAHNPFNLANSINIAPFSDDPAHVDYRDFLLYKTEQIRLCGSYARIDRVGEAHALPVESGTQDYVISSHVVEHLPDLISAFLEWNRVLKPNGIIFMIFPKRNAQPSDADRPITTVEHFVEDFEKKHSVATHPLNPGHGVRGHYHVFTLQSMLGLIKWCNTNLELAWRVEATEETDRKVGNGHTVVCRYRPDAAPLSFVQRLARWLYRS